MNKRKPISKKLREQVYQKYNGHCAYCGCELKIKDMQVDHILSVARAKWIKDELDLNNIDNLMPSCRSCNYYKDTCSIETFRKNLSTLMERVRKQYIFRLAEKYGMVQEMNWDGKFYFEKVNNIWKEDKHI